MGVIKIKFIDSIKGLFHKLDEIYTFQSDGVELPAKELKVKALTKVDNLSLRHRQQLYRLISEVLKKEKITVYETGGSWGDAIKWSDFSQRNVVGWKVWRPSDYDLLLSDMNLKGTGKSETVVFVLVDVEHYSDPPDMFSATALEIGFVVEEKEA